MALNDDQVRQKVAKLRNIAGTLRKIGGLLDRCLVVIENGGKFAEYANVQMTGQQKLDIVAEYEALETALKTEVTKL